MDGGVGQDFVVEHREVVYLDIETVAHWDPSKFQAPDRFKTESVRQEKAYEAWQRTALDPDYGSIITIGLSKGGKEPIALWTQGPAVTRDPFKEPSGKENPLLDAARIEESLLEELQRFFEPCVLVTWNGAHFDVPFLIRHALKHRLFTLAKNIRASKHIDLARIWSLGIYKEFPALHQVAEFLGFKGEEMVIGGGEIGKAYLWGDLQSIERHMKDDIRALIHVADRMKQGGLW